jgi:Pin2-interacting protein X1
MGRVTENKKRKRIADDPNNTRWARNETSFGQRILRSQGWQPGSTLGAVDAAHAEFFTEGSASHIRARIREDGVGIGFGGRDPATEGRHPGMDILEEVLARLNGKSQATIEADKKQRDADKRRDLVARKYGIIKFVSGGLLVGDEVKKDADEEETDKGGKEGLENMRLLDKAAAELPIRSQEKSKKRKASEQQDGHPEPSEDAAARKKRRKEEKAAKEGDKSEKKSKSKKSKKSSSSESSSASSTDDFSDQTPTPATAADDSTPEPVASKQPKDKRKKKQSSVEQETSSDDTESKKNSKKSKRDKSETDDGKKRRRKEESVKPVEEAPSSQPLSKNILVARMKALLAAESRGKVAQAVA